MDNDWMGDPDRSLACRQGNHLMYVTLLLSMLGSLNDNRVVLEQPGSGCLFEIPIVNIVIRLIQAMKIKTYGFIFRYFAFSLLGILHSNLKYRFPVLVSSVPPRGAEELATSWKELERPKLVAAVLYKVS